MRFGRTPEQEAFARVLDDLLAAAAVPAAHRAWACGNHESGLALGRDLAAVGVSGLLVAPESGGLGAGLSDAVIALERLGYHGVPGPWIETIALAPLLAGAGASKALRQMADGQAVLTLAAPPLTPWALDADAADQVYLLSGNVLFEAVSGQALESVAPARRLFEVRAGQQLACLSPGTVTAAHDAGALACAALLLGAGERLLHESVGYARSRAQFGRRIGEFQALKHLLADVRVKLDFVRPLVHAAALAWDHHPAGAGRDVSAAKVAAAGGAYQASRTALQVHGAIGYTLEFDLSIWILWVRALVSAWGTANHHRQRVLEALRS